MRKRFRFCFLPSCHLRKTLLFSFFIVCGMQSFAYVSQSNWRWRNNNGSETSATWRGNQNQTITVGSVDSIVRLRIQLQNGTGSDKTVNTNLQYASAPDGPWRYVTNFKDNNAFTLSNTNSLVADQSATTQQITGSTDAFSPGNIFVKTNELDVPIANSTTSEYEYSLQPTDNIQPNTTYYFKIPGLDYSVVLPSLQTTTGINTKQKVISNGSFEDSLKDWTFTVASGASAATNIIDSVHKDGIKSFVVNVSKASVLNPVTLSHTVFPLSVGHTYLVRFWAFSKKNSAPMQLNLAGNKTLPYDYKLYTGWQEYQFAFKASDPSVALSFLFQSATTYTIDKVDILDENNEEVDVPMNYMWQNNRPENEYSWLSADGENSEPLPDGRTVWTFSDGWYGYNDTTTNSLSTHQLLRNTFVTQSKPRPDGVLNTIIGGTVDQPQALMNPPDKRDHDNFFWPRDMTVDNDSLKVLLPEVIQVNEGDPLTDGNREAVGVFSLPDLTLRSIQWMPWLDSTYYIALCKADDGYTYAYGSHPISAFENHAVVARFITGQLSATTPWQFLTDTGWSFDSHNSKEIADVQLFSVTRLGTNNYASLFLNPLSDKIEVEFAQNPIGPWVGKSIVGQIKGEADILAYFGILHEETASNGVYTFSYSSNGTIPEMLDDKTSYWPTYLKADIKSLSPFNDAVLPVTLLQFTANADGKQIVLQWQTTNEINNNYFLVQRSIDGRNWTTIATIKANAGASNEYTTHDLQPLTGKNYYRLQQFDKSGKFTYSDIRLVTMSSNASVIVSPNPTHGSIHLIINSQVNDKITAILTDMKGTVIHQEMLSVTASYNSYSLHTNKPLAAGLYMLRLKGSSLNTSVKVAVE